MNPGFAPIRRGLLEHLAGMGPHAIAAYLCMHLTAKATGPEAGTVYITEREVARLCGMSAASAHNALAKLQPRYIRRIAPGAFAIENWRGCSPNEQPAHLMSNLLNRRASCSPIEQHIRKEKGEGKREKNPPLPLAAARPGPMSVPIAAAASAAAAGVGFSSLAAAKSAAHQIQAPGAATADSPLGRAPADAAYTRRSRAESTRRAGAAPLAAVAPKRIDPRHGAVRDLIFAAYRDANGLECPWDGRAARRLSEALAAAPAWPIETWLHCIRHRFASELPLGEDPALWVRALAEYSAGPLDRYRRPLRAHAGAASVGRSPDPTADPPPRPPATLPEGVRFDPSAAAALSMAMDAARPKIGPLLCMQWVSRMVGWGLGDGVMAVRITWAADPPVIVVQEALRHLPGITRLVFGAYEAHAAAGASRSCRAAPRQSLS